jgi:hypothetical protein
VATYSGDPRRNWRDALRFRLDDTDIAEPRFEDAELDALLASQGLGGNEGPGNVDAPALLRAVLEGLAILEGRYMLQETRVQIGHASFDLSGTLEALRARRQNLQAVLSATGGWYAGGISKADKALEASDTDRVPPSFRRGQHDFSTDLSGPEPD